MRLVMIGTGYVGLVSGACFAHLGHDVTCLDIDETKINKLQKGISPIYEPGLEKLLKTNIEEKKLKFTSDVKQAIQDAEVCFLTLPTPSTDEGKAELSYILSAADQLADMMDEYKLIVIKSTVPPKTCHMLREHIHKRLESLNKHYNFDVVSNPEFLREGSAVYDFMNPDRIIIGADNESCFDQIKALYAPLHLDNSKLITMDTVSSEMTKYAANSMLATRISFMNELSGLCEKIGANIENVRVGIGSDQRIGHQFLRAGVGFGGSCFPKDIRALIASSKQYDYEMPILTAVESINRKQKKLLAQKIKSYFNSKGGLKGKTIAIWGISFKPETDDIREAPSIELIKELINQGASLRLYDPVAMNNAQLELSTLSNLKWCEDEYEASEGADAVALVTEWQQFKLTDLESILDQMSGKALFDGRNHYLEHDLREKGFEYFAIGMPTS